MGVSPKGARQSMSKSAWFPRLRLLGSALLVATAILASAQDASVEITQKVGPEFTFVAYGDTRFTDPSNVDAANAQVRRTLVAEIGRVHPAFIAITGDLVFAGDSTSDWKTWDTETEPWRKAQIPVYPALGNHDTKGDPQVALGNYFHRFPALHRSRYYSVRIGKILLLTLDSNIDELSGSEGDWLKRQLDNVPTETDFVVIMLHHPPNTSATDDKTMGGGHSVRAREQDLARSLEERQKNIRARLVVIAGHVHNYDRHEQNGITYFVSGGGGAHAYPIRREPNDPYQSDEINYHFLLLTYAPGVLKVTMHRLQLVGVKPVWTEPDTTEIVAKQAAQSAQR
jgi:Icc-related predicted phosphoesterase